ncbi:TetR/AcrR family transcriptional regulator [Thermincola potens]|uniref:Transcriptional regulator, TetR family n=1 Tax=Thermincola potens (strain JR) TaxID=635013 RepID=D5X9S7_THEPJ|nr:TetR/AcrR family transcriptional regulator [Thermincola potens]ADG81148.1 transcriptional regulator, TetR family [Thermincola potens JR]
MRGDTEKLSFKQRQILEREEQILNVARRMFAEKGFYGTNLNDVAAEVGIARGTIYLHFPTKEQLLAAIIRKADEQLMARLSGVIKPQDDPLTKLEKIFRQYLQTCHEYEDLIRVMSHELRRAVGSRLYEEKGNKSVTVLVENTINEAKAKGLVDPEIDTTIASRAFFSVVTVETFKEAREDKNLSVEKIIESALKIYFQGIASRRE